MSQITIALDAGHGGSDSGAVYEGRREKDDTLRLVKAVGQILEDNGINVVYTRSTDIYETPFKKATDGNNSGADYFVSIHRNSSENDNQYSGVETLVYNDDGIKAVMARNINAELDKTGFRNLGVDERPNLVVLKRTKMPAVLVEVGFINNDSDNATFDNNFNAIAQAIANGILKTLREDPSRVNKTDSDNVIPEEEDDASQTTDDSMNNSTNGSMNDSMNGSMNDSMNGSMNDSMNGSMNGSMNDSMDDSMNNSNMPDSYYNTPDYNSMYRDAQNGTPYNTDYSTQYDNFYNNMDNADSNPLLSYPDDDTTMPPQTDAGELRNIESDNFTTINEEPAGKLYRVQVGAYKQKDNADRMLNSLLMEGFPAFILNQDGYYKVQVGAFMYLTNAIKMERRLRRFHYSTYIVYS